MSLFSVIPFRYESNETKPAANRQLKKESRWAFAMSSPKFALKTDLKSSAQKSNLPCGPTKSQYILKCKEKKAALN